ncbi:MAG: type II toxin-antitoxin system VapC family toxin [Candidatus Thorarchaeota archaeon]|jgi:rRNA-processing protein FCF1
MQKLEKFVNKVVILVVVDTNFLTVPFQFNVDVLSESRMVLEQRVEFVILRSVLNEINKLAETARGSNKRAFRIALELAENCKIVDVQDPISEMAVDDQLIEHTAQVGGVLATNDKELRARARDRGIPVLLLRGKKRLVLEGEVL